MLGKNVMRTFVSGRRSLEERIDVQLQNKSLGCCCNFQALHKLVTKLNAQNNEEYAP